MTHPDILTIERFGELEPIREPLQIGECYHCGASIYEEDDKAVFESDRMFCDLHCRRLYDTL